MTESGRSTPLHSPPPARETEPTVISDRQQSELFARISGLVAALSQVDARVETTPDLDSILYTLGHELKRLGLECFMALLEVGTQTLAVRYWSIEPKALARLEQLVGVSVLGLRLPRDRFSVSDFAGDTQDPLELVEWPAAVAPLFPGVPAEVLAQAGQAVGVTPDTRLVLLPLRVADRPQGLLGIWHDELSPSDLPALSIFAFQVAITVENARLFEQIRAARDRLRRLIRRVVSAQEDERQRVSRELHDEAGQALTALKISLELIRAELPPELEQFQLKMGEATALVDSTLEHIHFLVQDLRPPVLDAIGLNAALEDYCKDFARRTRLSIAYSGLELRPLPGAVSISFYRFLQEALTNVAKHACARQVDVVLDLDGECLSLSVEDDGRGFGASARLASGRHAPGMGLLGMQERFELLGGHLKIESEPGRGARLYASVPVNEVE